MSFFFTLVFNLNLIIFIFIFILGLHIHLQHHLHLQKVAIAESVSAAMYREQEDNNALSTQSQLMVHDLNIIEHYSTVNQYNIAKG